MNKLTTIFITFMWGMCSACSGTDDPNIPKPPSQPPLQPPTQPNETVVFQDDFSTFNTAVWNKESHQAGWTNQELQSYDPAHVSVEKDGDRTVLTLTAERKNDLIMSGRVNTKGKKSFKYGKLEASIKLPQTANGLWPAFWMMGDNNKEWPACGEIDIMEMGDAEGIKSGTTSKRINTALHFGASSSAHEQKYYVANASVNLQDGNYHTYTMVWDATKIEISIDGIPFNTFATKDNPYFQNDFFILFNLAVGGSFTGITNISGITALKEGQKAVMYIDWIKIIETK